MLGMEKLIAGMTGMTAPEMAAKVKEFETFVKGGSEALASLAETQKQILAKLEAMEAQANGTGK